MVNKVKYCAFVPLNNDDRCNKPHTEVGAYCPECRRQYQREYKKGLRGSGDRLNRTDCEYCGAEIRGKAKMVAGVPACDICDLVVTHLSSVPLPVYDLLLEGVQRIHDNSVTSPYDQPEREMTLAEKLGVTDDDPITLALLNGQGLGPPPKPSAAEEEPKKELSPYGVDLSLPHIKMGLMTEESILRDNYESAIIRRDSGRTMIQKDWDAIATWERWKKDHEIGD
jgi:hypothetical protein